MKKINNKPPKWMLQLFSDREESDDSNIEDNGNSNDEDNYYTDEDEEEGEGAIDNSDDSDSDSDREDNIPAKKPVPNKVRSPKKFQEEYEMPGLVPTYSKVE